MLARCFQTCKQLSWTINPVREVQVSCLSRWSAPVLLSWSANLCVHTQCDHDEGLSAFLGTETKLQDHKKEQHFVDKLRIQVKAGSGGAGCVSFWKSPAKGKFTPADGGNGGRGGDVVIQATSGIKSLRGVKTLYKARDGGHGRKQRKIGARGADIVIKVPTGTVVFADESHEHQEEDVGPSHLAPKGGMSSMWRDETDDDMPTSRAPGKMALLADLVKDGQKVIVAHGGEGGRGNASFRTPPNRPASRESEPGKAGEVANICLEVKTIADIGLVGCPNAGKSTLLRALSAAKPQVASFPFTTLRPHLGTLHCEDGNSLVIADIPGLIQGASQAKGLGHDFLRHIERTGALAYVVDLSGGSEVSLEALSPGRQLQLLKAELNAFSKELLRLPAIVVANKVDLLEDPDARVEELKKQSGNVPVVAVSALRESGITSLKALLHKLTLHVAKICDD